jgi:hypothetical protein
MIADEDFDDDDDDKEATPRETLDWFRSFKRPLALFYLATLILSAGGLAIILVVWLVSAVLGY